MGRDGGAPTIDIPPLPIPLPIQPARPPGGIDLGAQPSGGDGTATPVKPPAPRPPPPDS
jgi:hypothetical protein